MFGYFRPYHSQLTNSEKRKFESYYCRICYCLRIAGGQTARFCTTYDAAIYSIIVDLQMKATPPPQLPCERFGKKNLRHYVQDDIGLKFARLSLISLGEKIRDDQVDNGGAGTRLASALFSSSIAKAKEKEPALAKNSYDGTERINELQSSNALPEKVFEAYGDMAVGSFNQFLDMSSGTEELIRSVSEWIFLVDMICDYDDDYKNGTYNGFKTDGYKTFKEYFDVNYSAVLEVAEKMSNRLIAAVMAVRDDSELWTILYKIITHAVDTVIPDVIEGKDVKFHYFSDLFERIGKNKRAKKERRRLGVENYEKS